MDWWDKYFIYRTLNDVDNWLDNNAASNPEMDLLTWTQEVGQLVDACKQTMSSSEQTATDALDDDSCDP
ncbi:MAG: hypothetical protein ISP86_02230 [Shewanellaceae bacterium]|nr:hypothetical protein [Shewanellaceae bacterium]